MKRVRLAVVGCGSIGMEHVRALRALPSAEVYAVVSRNRRRRASAARLADATRAEKDLRSVLDDGEVAAVVLCTPTHTHYEFGRAVLRSGKHLLLEKPMTSSLRRGKLLVQMAARRGLCLMIAQTQRFMPAYSVCRLRIAEGGIGRPLLVTGRWMEARRTRRNWRGRITAMSRELGDSLIYHHGSHTVDFVLWAIGGEVEEVHAAAITARRATVRSSDFSVLLRMQSGCVVSLTHSFTSRLSDRSLIVVGEKGTLRILNHTQLEQDGRVLVEGTFEAHLRDAILAQDAEFARAILERDQPTASGMEVLRGMAILAKVSRLARECQPTNSGRLEGKRGDSAIPS